MLSGNSLRQTVHTHGAFGHQAAKLVAALLRVARPHGAFGHQEAKLLAALLRVARVTAGLAESNGSLPPVL